MSPLSGAGFTGKGQHMDNEMLVRLGKGKRVSAVYGGFTINTDQSEKAGGEASAPEPFDLFLASLGTCAGFYVLSFCQRRNIPTDRIQLRQRWQRNEQGKVDEITLLIELPADFPEKYSEAVVRAAEGCAVKKLFDNPPRFRVESVLDAAPPT